LRLRYSVRTLAKKILRILRLTGSADNDFEYSKLKPWALSCRGHYSYRSVSSIFLNELDKRLHKNASNLDLYQSCTIHYRLGDLLTLVEKNPIPSPIIVATISNLLRSYDFRDLCVFSDSPERAFDFFNKMVPLEVKSPAADTVDVMANSIDSKYFIGTSSKISFWIAGIRAQSRNSPSFLPLNNLPQISGVVGDKSEYISTYSVSS
jgi:hypothetical protein